MFEAIGRFAVGLFGIIMFGGISHLAGMILNDETNKRWDRVMFDGMVFVAWFGAIMVACIIVVVIAVTGDFNFVS